MTTKEEFQERRERWAEALESGKYAQATEFLRREDGYCCLGVLCDLYREENNAEDWSKQDGHYYYQLQDATVPLRVRRWIGLIGDDGSYEKGAVRTSLAGQNDRGATFAEIAAIIRAAPEGLFVDGDA